MKKNKFVTYLEYIPFKLLISIAYLFPYKWNLWMGKQIGKLLHFIAKKSRKDIKERMTMALGNEYTEVQIDELVWKNFIYYGTFLFELLSLPKLVKKNMVPKLVEVDDECLAMLEKSRSSGIGSLWLVGHFGNWEYVVIAVASHGYPPQYIYRPLDNSKMDKFIADMRNSTGARGMTRDDARLIGKEVLAKNQILAFLFDQNTLDGVFAPFFGKLASTVRGPALFAWETKAPVFHGMPFRKDDDTYKMVFSEVPVRWDIKDKTEFLEVNTTIFNKFHEDMIRRAPDQWWWIHPRWKTRPPWEKN